MSNLVFVALLSGVSWESIVRMLDLRERAKGVGDGSVEGHRYTIIQRGERISIVLPDPQPQEKCLEAAKKIYSRLAPESAVQIVTMGHASSHCNYCLKPTPLPYRCYRCKGWYCESHRLPEQHNCPGKGGAEKVVERVGPEKSEMKDKKSEIVVLEAPCGKTCREKS